MCEVLTPQPAGDQLISTGQVAHQATEHTTGRLSRLQQVTAALSRPLTPDQVCHVIMEHALAALGAQAGSVGLIAEDSQSLEIVTASGYPPKLMREFGHFQLTAPLPL